MTVEENNLCLLDCQQNRMGVVLDMLSSIVVDRCHFVVTLNQNQDAKENVRKKKKH